MRDSLILGFIIWLVDEMVLDISVKSWGKRRICITVQEELDCEIDLDAHEDNLTESIEYYKGLVEITF